MGGQITREILEAYLSCKTKAHLKLAGQPGTLSVYGEMLVGNRQEIRRQAHAKILARHSEVDVASDIPLTAGTLRAGLLFVLDATLEDDPLSLRFDGLKRVDGPSKLGDFHYLPVLFHEADKLRQEHRLLLAALASVLGDLQGRQPEIGIIYHGRQCQVAKLHLTERLRARARRILREIEGLRKEQKPLKLMLNKHCQACEFRSHCQAEATRQDDLSLLRGMGENEIRAQNRRGIFTVTQLSYTFRPRKKSKRAKDQSLPQGRRTLTY
jgi:predicted RecB family nuclease